MAKAKLHQRERSLVLAVRTRGEWRTRALTKHPSSPTAGGERFLCLKLGARRTPAELLCPGGRRADRAGLSRISKRGAKDRGYLPASIRRPAPNRIELSFRFAAAGLHVGRFRWSVVSGWSGPGCDSAPAGEQPGGGAETPAPGTSAPGTSAPVTPTPTPPTQGTTVDRPAACLDRAPNGDRGYRGRVFELRPSGCTSRGADLVRNGPRDEKVVALTFDDGPAPYTSRVLDILDERRVDATFYVIGSQVHSRSALMRGAAAGGHELANHSWRHSYFPTSGDLRMTSAAIRRATGYRPCTFRPPGGNVNGDLVRRASAAGMTTVLWDVDTRDWTTPGSGPIYSQAVGSTRPGSIILMHDGGGYRGQSVAALPRIISTLRKRGYRFATVHELLGGRTLYRKVR